MAKVPERKGAGDLAGKPFERNGQFSDRHACAAFLLGKPKAVVT